MNEAYIAGVLRGDGFCSHLSIGVCVADQDFAQTFADAMNTLFGLSIKPRQERTGHWMVRTSNKRGLYTHLNTLRPETNEQKAMWLRGFFDSEGNANFVKLPKWEASYQRRISFYNTELWLIEYAHQLLLDLGITSIIRLTKNSAGHIGTKPVYELYLRNGKQNFGLFVDLIGSSIVRKQEKLRLIVGSYKEDISAHCREQQLKGAQAKRANSINVNLPYVLGEMRKLIASGTKPTISNFLTIKYYGGLKNIFSAKELFIMATENT